jgi:hypothetical protein
VKKAPSNEELGTLNVIVATTIHTLMVIATIVFVYQNYNNIVSKDSAETEEKNLHFASSSTHRGSERRWHCRTTSEEDLRSTIGPQLCLALARKTLALGAGIVPAEGRKTRSNILVH